MATLLERLVGDAKSLAGPGWKKPQHLLAAIADRKKKRRPAASSRSADCGRDDGGRFGGGNDCAKDGGSESPKESAKSFPKEITAGDPSLKKYVPFRPVADTKNSDFARPADDESLRAAIGAAKGSRFADRYGAPRELPQGSPVAIRIDVPTFKKSGAYAVTVHKATKGGFDPSPVGYDSVARLDGPVVFESKENDAVLVAAGLSQKFPLATVKGSLSKDRSIPDDIDDWTAVGYDPQKAAYFYDKRTGDEVTGGTDSISVGNSVFVRKPTYATNPRNAARQYRSAGFWGLESRDADCGRDESGKFGSGNKCQEDAGGTAPEKVTWSAGSGEPPFEGAEKAASVSVSGNKEVTDSLDTLGVDKSNIVDLAGAGGGSVFIRPAPDLTTKLPGGVLPVLISWDRPLGGVDYGIEGSSAVGKNDKGESILYHSTLTVDPRAKDTPAKRHAAATAFYRMMSESVQAARKAGISEVRFNASGSKVDKSWKGYTIWPRMGFDAPLPADLKAKLPETLSHAKSLLDLHATREGTQWWDENGREVDVSFRLDDPSSPQSKIMSRFIKRFATDRRDMPLGAGDGWLSPADLARFDELWEEIWDEGDLDEYEYAESRSADCGRDEGGRFGPKNQCQEDGKGQSYESKASTRDIERIKRHAADGNEDYLRRSIEDAMEYLSPNDIAKSLGFTTFDSDGSMSDALKKPVSSSQFFASSRKKAAVSHLASLASAATFVPEIASQPIDFESFDSFTSGLARRLKIPDGVVRRQMGGTLAACNLQNGHVTALFDRPPTESSRKGYYNRGLHSTDHPAHYMVHEYAHVLQSQGLRKHIIDRDASDPEAWGNLLKDGRDLADTDVISYRESANSVVARFEEKDFRQFMVSRLEKEVETMRHGPMRTANEKTLQWLKDGKEYVATQSEISLWLRHADRFAKANPHSWSAKIRGVSLYATTDPLELAAEYWTAVTLGYKNNDEMLDQYCEAIFMPRPQKRVPDSSSPRKIAAKKLRL